MPLDEVTGADNIAARSERIVPLSTTGAANDTARSYLDEARAAALRPNGTAPGPAPDVHSVAIVGGGTMGTGIAVALANAGLAVTLIDEAAAQIERAEAAIVNIYAASVAKGRLTAATATQRRTRIGYSTTIDAAGDVDLAIEAVFEDLAVKRSVFAQLDRVAAARTLLATNTSALDIDALAAATECPDRVIGLHFFSPANVMRLVEIVPGTATSRASIAKAVQFCERIAKIGVIAGNCDGFIGNRMLYPYRREAEFLLEEGALPHDVDRVLHEFGFAMGPFGVSDLAGLDIGWKVRRRRFAAAPPSGRYSRVADRLCELGRFGQKSGAGYYRYDPGSRTPIPDPLVEALICDSARAAGVARRPIDDDEIRERCVYALINEAAMILAAGIAQRASDIDLVWVYGYGFPAARGGPLFYADTLGLSRVLSDLRKLETLHGDAWRPAPLLAELAATGATFTGHFKPRPQS